MKKPNSSRSSVGQSSGFLKGRNTAENLIFGPETDIRPDTDPAADDQKRGPVVDVQPEIWKAIPGFEGLYEASNLGRVRSPQRGWSKADEAVQIEDVSLFMSAAPLLPRRDGEGGRC